jgi:hypothetical protein
MAGTVKDRSSGLDKKKLAKILLQLWEDHDKLERKILTIQRKFTDEEITKLMEGESIV